jgi:prepilin-type N-terminal cleavage/methylation domain-containing protein
MPRARSANGFTLVELMVAMVITSIIVGAIAGGLMVSSANYNASATRLALSSGAQQLSAWLSNDVESAGPSGASINTNSSTATTGCSGGIVSGSSNVLAISGVMFDTGVAYAVAYRVEGSTLVRYACTNGGTPSRTVLDRAAQSATTSLSGQTVTMSITDALQGSSYSYAVSATRRTTQSVSPTTTLPAAVAAVAVSSGSGQSATVTTAYGSPLVALVTDTVGNPDPGVSVTFTGPSSGTSGSFASGCVSNPNAYTCTVTSDASGRAASSVLTAGAVTGSFSVNATVTGLLTPATFSLTNTPPPTPVITFPTSTSKETVANGTTRAFTITGSQFLPGATVTISGGFTVLTTTWSSSSAINVTVTAKSGNGNRGTYNLTVANSGGSAATSPNSMVNS